jgi:magnesium chelatase subunit I
VELVYEGEQEGASGVALNLIDAAIKTLFPANFPEIKKLEHENEAGPYEELINWFFEQSGFELLDDINDVTYKSLLDSVSPLNKLIESYQPDLNKADSYFMKEFVLWGLVAYKKLSKRRYVEGVQFKDLYGSFISDL